MASDSETLSPAIPDDVETAARSLLEAACERDWRLTVAESCTGGLLASLLTDVTGVSHAFDRGFVTYSDAAKYDLLGVSRQQIDACGAVSKAVALAMAEGALSRSDAHVAAALTGFAGPCDDDEEEGLVHIAVAGRSAATRHRELHYGALGRGAVRLAAVRTALAMMRDAL